MRRHAWSLLLAHPRWLLIGLLILASAGCARRDWVSDLLVLTDVTGTWEGWVRTTSTAGGLIPPSPVTMVLQQSGPKVTGELSWARGRGQVEGILTGEVLTFTEGIKVELAVDGDEMWGRTDNPFTDAFSRAGVYCQPCFFRFRRATSSVPAPSEPPAPQQR